VQQETRHPNGAPNEECDATRAPPPLPPTNHQWRLSPDSTIPVAQTWTGWSPPHHTSAMPTGRALTQQGALPWRHQQASADPQPHYHGEAGPKAPTEERRGSPSPPHLITCRLCAARPRPHQHLARHGPDPAGSEAPGVHRRSQPRTSDRRAQQAAVIAAGPARAARAGHGRRHPRNTRRAAPGSSRGGARSRGPNRRHRRRRAELQASGLAAPTPERRR
jgi:hypothetical protein